MTTSLTTNVSKRWLSLSLFLFSLFTLLILRYYQIQVVEHDKWMHYANNQHHRVVTEPYRRGVFYSNTSLKTGHPTQLQPFVVDVLLYHLYVDPLLIEPSYKEEMIKSLKKMMPAMEEISSHFYKKSRSRRVALWLRAEEKQEIEAWWYPFAKQRKIPRNALYFIKDYKRSYPLGRMLGQVLHTVREDRVTTGGLEAVFNEYLKGVEGKKMVLRSPRYELDTDLLEVDAKDGCDVHLTVNHVLQAICEEELAIGIKKVKGKAGMGVVMDPHTGEILAIANYPFFDPANYRDYYNDTAKLGDTRNKAIMDCFEPGSTMKPISIALALLANEELKKRGKSPIFSPSDKIASDQSKFPGRTQPLQDTHLHHYLNMYMAIQKSSNIYPARLIQRVIEELGPKWYREKLRDVFGLGVKTGVEMPYENRGLVPTPGKMYASGAFQWSAPTPYSLAIGYNVLVNAIQMCRAYSVFANGGYLVRPTILRKITQKDRLILEGLHEKNRVLDESIVKEIVKAMKFSTKTGGSAPLANVPGFTEAGKTATAEKLIEGTYSKTQHFSSFLGFVPADNPRFVIFIGVDEPEKAYIQGFGTTHFGGKCAAPIFREIAKRSLQYLGVTPDDPYGYPKGDPRSDPSKAKWVKEIEELEATYNRWNR